MSLRWTGSIQAQKEAEAAYAKLKPKAKKPKLSRNAKRRRKALAWTKAHHIDNHERRPVADSECPFTATTEHKGSTSDGDRDQTD